MYGLGLSATIPMLISTPGHPMEKQMGLVSLAETIFSLPMVIIAVGVLVTLPLLNAMLHPKPGQPVTESDRALHSTEPSKAVAVDVDADTIASKLNNSRILAMAIGALGMAYVVVHFVRGGGVDLNLINFFILFLGILLLGTPPTPTSSSSTRESRRSPASSSSSRSTRASWRSWPATAW